MIPFRREKKRVWIIGRNASGEFDAASGDEVRIDSETGNIVLINEDQEYAFISEGTEVYTLEEEE